MEHNITWCINELMAASQIATVRELFEKINETGHKISASQLRKLLAKTPIQINLNLLHALTVVFNCSINELLEQPEQIKKEVEGKKQEVVREFRSPIAAIRPKLGRPR